MLLNRKKLYWSCKIIILDRKCVVGSDTVTGSVVKWSWSTWFVPGLIHYLTTNPVLTDNVPI